jgi:hypothetical protein
MLRFARIVCAYISFENLARRFSTVKAIRGFLTIGIICTTSAFGDEELYIIMEVYRQKVSFSKSSDLKERTSRM